MTEMYISFPIVHISFIITPLYNFIDDSYFAKMPVLRHLSQRLILSGFRLSPRKWQKIPGYEFLRLGQIWNPERFYSCSRQICHQHKAKASLRNLFHLTYTTSSVILFLYQLFVSIRKGFITRSLGLKRSQEYSYAQSGRDFWLFLFCRELHLFWEWT